MSEFLAVIVGIIQSVVALFSFTPMHSELAPPVSSQDPQQQIEAMAKDSSGVSDARQIVSVLSRYYADYGTYPRALQGLLDAEGNMTDSDGTVIIGSPTQLFGDVKYVSFSNGQHYVVWVALNFTKKKHGFAFDGPYGPVNSDIAGVTCTDPHTFCLVDEGTQINSTPIQIDVAELDMSDWKTYRDEDAGLSFKYPPGFTVTTSREGAYSGGWTTDAYLYNYRYEFYPEYKSPSGTSRSLTRYSNFGLHFHPNSVSPDYSAYVNYAKGVTIGTVAYTEVKRDLSRHESMYFLKYPSGETYVQVKYTPIIDTGDVGGLNVQPDYVAGVSVVRENSRFLDADAQTKILNAVLASVKLSGGPKPVVGEASNNTGDDERATAVSIPTVQNAYPSFNFTSPAGGANVAAGKPIHIAWESSDPLPDAMVNLSYASCNRNCSKIKIANGLPPTGMYDVLTLPKGDWYIFGDLLPAIDGFTPGQGTLVRVI